MIKLHNFGLLSLVTVCAIQTPNTTVASQQFVGAALAVGVASIVAYKIYGYWQHSRKKAACLHIFNKYNSLSGLSDEAMLQLAEEVAGDVQFIEKTRNCCQSAEECFFLNAILNQINAVAPSIMERASQVLEQYISKSYCKEFEYLQAHETISNDNLRMIVDEKFGSYKYKFLAYRDTLNNDIKRVSLFGQKLADISTNLCALKVLSDRLLQDLYKQEHMEQELDSMRNELASLKHQKEMELDLMKSQLNSLKFQLAKSDMLLRY